MMKKRKNRLDEMQEQEMLKIEHNGCWLAFWGLFIVMGIQVIVYGREHKELIAGEWTVFMCLALYIVAACIRRGIWDRRLAPTPKVNLFCSVIAGIIAGIVHTVLSYREYHKIWGAVAVGIFMMCFIAFTCFAGLTVCVSLYRKRTKRFENEEEIVSEVEKNERK